MYSPSGKKKEFRKQSKAMSLRVRILVFTYQWKCKQGRKKGKA